MTIERGVVYMFDTKLEMVLKELSLTEYQTSLDISEKLNISEKTVRVRIAAISEENASSSEKISAAIQKLNHRIIRYTELMDFQSVQ